MSNQIIIDATPLEHEVALDIYDTDTHKGSAAKIHVREANPDFDEVRAAVDTWAVENGHDPEDLFFRPVGNRWQFMLDKGL